MIGNGRYVEEGTEFLFEVAHKILKSKSTYADFDEFVMITNNVCDKLGKANAENRELKRELEILKAENEFLIDHINEMGECDD